jgi:hypothetical protein
MGRISHLVFPGAATGPTVVGSLRGGPDTWLTRDMDDPHRLDRSDPEGAVAAAAKRCSNWGRWGPDDVLGTLNFLTAAKRAQGASLVRRGASFSLAQRFEADGPQKGWRRRTNPVLAADCAADGVFEFLLTAAPLPVTGAVGAPVNPIAVK